MGNSRIIKNSKWKGKILKEPYKIWIKTRTGIKARSAAGNKLLDGI